MRGYGGGHRLPDDHDARRLQELADAKRPSDEGLTKGLRDARHLYMRGEAGKRRFRLGRQLDISVHHPT